MCYLKFDSDLFSTSYDYDNMRMVFTNKYNGYSYDIKGLSFDEYCDYKKFCENLNGDIEPLELAHLYNVKLEKLPRDVLVPNPQLGIIDYISRSLSLAIDPLIAYDGFILINIFVLIVVSLFGLSFCAYSVTYYYCTSYSNYDIIIRYVVLLFCLLGVAVLREFWKARFGIDEGYDLTSVKRTWANVIPAIVLANIGGCLFVIDFFVMKVFQYRGLISRLINDIAIGSLLALVFYSCLIPVVFHRNLEKSIMRVFGNEDEDNYDGFIKLISKSTLFSLPILIIVILLRNFGVDLFLYKYFWEYRLVYILILIALLFRVWPMEKKKRGTSYFITAYAVSIIFHVVTFIGGFMKKDGLITIPLKICYIFIAQQLILLLIIVIGIVVFSCNGFNTGRYKNVYKI